MDLWSFSKFPCTELWGEGPVQRTQAAFFASLGWERAQGTSSVGGTLRISCTPILSEPQDPGELAGRASRSLFLSGLRDSRIWDLADLRLWYPQRSPAHTKLPSLPTLAYTGFLSQSSVGAGRNGGIWRVGCSMVLRQALIYHVSSYHRAEKGSGDFAGSPLPPCLVCQGFCRSAGESAPEGLGQLHPVLLA